MSPQTSDHGRQLRERSIRDARFDQAAHNSHHEFWSDSHSAFPVRLIRDPACELSRKVGAERERHWMGTMLYATTFLVDSEGRIRWNFQSQRAHRWPSPVWLATAASNLIKGQPIRDYIENWPSGRRHRYRPNLDSPRMDWLFSPHRIQKINGSRTGEEKEERMQL